MTSGFGIGRDAFELSSYLTRTTPLTLDTTVNFHVCVFVGFEGKAHVASPVEPLTAGASVTAIWSEVRAGLLFGVRDAGALAAEAGRVFGGCCCTVVFLFCSVWMNDATSGGHGSMVPFAGVASHSYRTVVLLLMWYEVGAQNSTSGFLKPS